MSSEADRASPTRLKSRPQLGRLLSEIPIGAGIRLRDTSLRREQRENMELIFGKMAGLPRVYADRPDRFSAEEHGDAYPGHDALLIRRLCQRFVGAIPHIPGSEETRLIQRAANDAFRQRPAVRLYEIGGQPVTARGRMEPDRPSKAPRRRTDPKS